MTRPGSFKRAESIATRNARSVYGRSRMESSRNDPRAIKASMYVYATSSSGTYADAWGFASDETPIANAAAKKREDLLLRVAMATLVGRLALLSIPRRDV